MKNRKLLDLMSLADDKYVSESDPQRLKQIRASVFPSRFKWTTFFVAVACFLLVLNIVILVPLLTRDDPVVPPSSSMPDTSGSGGLNQIQGPSNGGESQPPDVNPGDTTIVDSAALLEALDKLFAEGGIGDDEVNEEGSLAIFPSNSQASGISCGDIVAKSSSHIFYLRDKELCIYSIDKENSELASMISLGGYIDEMKEYARSIGWLETESQINGSYAYTAGWEMYLSPDQKTLTLIAVPSSSPITGVLTLDVSRAPTVKAVDFKMVSGNYVSSRLVDGELLLFTRYKIQTSYNKEKPVTYMPFFLENGKEVFSQNIYFPNDINSNAYLTVTRLDQSTASVNDTAAYLSYSDKLYVSKENIILTRRVYVGDKSVDYLNPPYNTEISVVSYGSEKLVHKGTATVNGYVKDQYSLDERDGILRIATTSYVTKDGQGYVWYETSASLFCVSLSTMEIVARVDNFAPEGEAVGAVSYNNNYVYVSGKSADPVYVFDLSDLGNITYTDTNTATTHPSLVDFGNGYFVSIGIGSNSQSLKIEVYRKDGDTPVSVCSHELANTYYPTDYRSYFIDSSTQSIGFAIRVYEKNVGYVNKYLLLRFNATAIEVLSSPSLDYQTRDAVRGFLDNGYYYVITDKGLSVFAINSI